MPCSVEARVCNNLPQPPPYILDFGGCGRLLHTLASTVQRVLVSPVFGTVSSLHAMICCAMLCYAILRYSMLCYAALCYALLCYAALCSAMHTSIIIIMLYMSYEAVL